MDSNKSSDTFSKINELARRRGFFWQSYEIYGGVGGFVTYGPIGTRLKLNIESKIRDIFIKKLEVYFTGNNLILITPYSGVDPETSLLGSGNAQGMDYFNMPGTKRYSFGIKLGF